MELLESSGSWIIALGKTLLNSLWLGILLLSLLKALFLMIPQRQALYRYHAALISLLLLVGFSFALFFHLYSPVREGSFPIPEGSLISTALSQLKPGYGPGGMLFYHYISHAYLAGMAIYLIKTLRDAGKVMTIRRKAKIIGEPWRQHFNSFRKKAGVSRKVSFLSIEGLATPFLTGVVKPAIIVPSAMLTQLSFNEVEALLMHELYHLKRYDHWVNLIQNVVEVLFFFNPAVRELSAMIGSEREKCIDDRVLEAQSLPLDYARALYLVSKNQNSRTFQVMAATGKGRSDLKSRIERILKPNTMKKNIREKTNALLIFLAGIALMILVSGFTSGLSITRHKDVPKENQAESFIVQIPSDTLTREEQQQLKEEIDKAMAEINWEEIKREMEEVKIEVLEEINWDEIKKEIELTKIELIEDIDWEEIKREIEEAKIEVLEDMDWEKMKMDIEEARRTIEVEIDWEDIKEEMEEVKVRIDLLMDDIDLDMDIDIDRDVEVEVDVEVESEKEAGESL